MGVLTVTKTYVDGQILGAINLDNAFDSIAAFINSGQISGDNIQDNSIGPAEIQTSAITAGKLAASSVTTVKIADASITQAKLATALQAFLVPPSRISAYAGDTAPNGWLMCDGTAVSRTTYATLYGIVGVRFGQGDGTTTFNLPDLRGRFLRGKDSGSARDPEASTRTAMATGGATGDNVGSIQGDDWKFTEGRIALYGATGSVSGTGVYPIPGAVTANGPAGNALIANSDGTKLGNETRPLNASMNYIIKV